MPVVSRNRTRPIFTRLAGAAILVCIVAGCRTETLCENSGPEPAWRAWDGVIEKGDHFYVGVASVNSILDEASARRRALVHAAEQAAQSLEIELDSVAPVTTGDPPRYPAVPLKDVVRTEVRAVSNLIIRGFKIRGTYFEKWRIRDSFGAPPLLPLQVLCARSLP